MRKISNIFLFISMLPCISNGQSSPNPNGSLEVAKMRFMAKQVIPPSPEAAELGRYGNVPISLFTGTPSINVPLYELKGSNTSLNINLSFNASGFKPTDPATWCGSGWSLNAGGVITRAVRGNPDNASNYFGVADVLNPPPMADIFGQDTYMHKINEHEIETQPDVYYYNFAGHTGKFVVKPDNTVFKHEKDLKIINSCVTCSSSSFTIVDENGFTYVFDEVEMTEMTPSDDEGQQSPTSYTYPSAWYLTAMYPPDGGHSIEFEYHSSPAGTSIQNWTASRSVSFTYGVRAPLVTNCREQVQENNANYQSPPFIRRERKYISKITLSSGGVVAHVDVLSGLNQREDAEDDSYARRLNQVKVYSVINGVDKLIKQYDFTYGYFFNPNNPIYKKRLRLDMVQEISVDGVTPSPPPYSFSYIGTEIPLPNTASIDHWGFFNKAFNISLVPGVTFNGVNIDNSFFPSRIVGDNANREADLGGSSLTMLNKIQYPTGGYSTFEYELNQAKFSGDIVHPVGGIRVKKTVDYSFNGKTATEKSYSYLLDDGTTSGKSGDFPSYATYSSYHNYPVPYGQYCCGEQELNCCQCNRQYDAHDLYTISVSANPVFSLGSFQGSHLGYTQVTESQTDIITGKQLGKTVYKYSFAQNFEYDDNIENGDLIRQSVFGNDGKLLQETSNLYSYSTTEDFFNGQLIKASELQSNHTIVCKTNTNEYIKYAVEETTSPNCIETRTIPTSRTLLAFSYFLQSKKLVQQTNKIYDQVSNTYLTTTKNFTYGNPAHNYPTLIEDITTNGEKLKTAIKYVADYTGEPSGDPQTLPPSSIIAFNIKDMRENNMPGVPVEKLQYRQDANGSNTRYISGELTDHILGKPSQVFLLESQPLLTSVTSSAITSGGFDFDSHYRLAGKMFYSSANLIEQIKTDDAPVAYLWDYSQLYPVAQITGARFDQFAYTSFESSGNGGFSFSGSSVPDISSPTGKQCYNFGTSITRTIDPNKKYIVSYWRKNVPAAFSVTGNISAKQGLTKNNWTYFEHTVTGTPTVTISGSGYIDELRLYPAGSQMATYTYEPLIGMTSQCDVNNNITYYVYDGLSRLAHIKDRDGYIVKSYQYNYGLGTAPVASQQTMFYNVQKQGTFTRQGCATGTYGDDVVYTVPYGKYAAISQAAADAKADADVQANGPAYANSTGLCQWRNAYRQVQIFKNNCTPEQGNGNAVLYEVLAGKYKSAISQADAEAKVDQDILTLGQTYANDHGTCSCAAEDQRMVNGVCETGTMYHVSAELQPDGQWLCGYKYSFSDAYQTSTYYYLSSTPCPVDP